MATSPVLKALCEPATTVIRWHLVEACGRALLAEGTACARAGSVNCHVEEGAKRSRAAGCEGRLGQASDCCPKQDARLALGLRPVSRWLGRSQKWDVVEEAGRVSCGPGFPGGCVHMGRQQGSNSGGSQVGRLIGRGSPRESGIPASWFYRDLVTLDCRGEPEVFKSCFPLCTSGVCVHCWSQEGKEEHSGG